MNIVGKEGNKRKEKRIMSTCINSMEIAKIGFPGRNDRKNCARRPKRERKNEYTYISMSSNSSRLRCRERNAAARFLTKRASRLFSPVTSGGTQSLVLMGPDGAARCRFGAGGEDASDALLFKRPDEAVFFCELAGEEDRFREELPGT